MMQARHGSWDSFLWRARQRWRPSAVAAIAVIAAGAVASAQAQMQTASAEPTIWDHNGSVVYLVASSQSWEFHYQKPRAGMLEVGARPGSLLFRGEIENGQYSGKAYIFNARCGQIPFQVKGPILDNDERITLTGGRRDSGETVALTNLIRAIWTQTIKTRRNAI
jgi:hypothetical protein